MSSPPGVASGGDSGRPFVRQVFGPIADREETGRQSDPDHAGAVHSSMVAVHLHITARLASGYCSRLPGTAALSSKESPLRPLSHSPFTRQHNLGARLDFIVIGARCSVSPLTCVCDRWFHNPGSNKPGVWRPPTWALLREWLRNQPGSSSPGVGQPSGRSRKAAKRRVS
jgi:hypothetical protein